MIAVPEILHKALEGERLEFTLGFVGAAAGLDDCVEAALGQRLGGGAEGSEAIGHADQDGRLLVGHE